MLGRRCFVVISFFIFYSFSAIAEQAGSYDSRTLEDLATHPTWQALLHFRPHGVLGINRSEVDDPSFFLASNGHVDPKAELNATLDAFKQPTSLGRDHAICQFPARFHWLKETLAEDLNHTVVACEEQNQWLQSFNAKSLTLIYPASYLNSPSSMYGHTLIRVDPEGEQQRSTLLAFSINFAAETDPSDNEVVFSWKGLTGGYPGLLTVQKYYTKVNDYSAIENRDIWEYRLKLSQQEVKQFLRHVWELRRIHFDYYFVDENCAYRILAIVDAATDRLDTHDEFRSHATPVDTIRTLNDAGLIQDAVYRPSMASNLRHQISETPTALQHVAVTIVDNPSLLDTDIFLRFDKVDRAKILELAYGYLRYTGKKENVDPRSLSKLSLTLLSARARLGVTSPFSAIEPPKIRDEMGHNSARISAAIGAGKHVQFSEIATRLTYHDLLDPSPGYIPGSAIAMGDVKFRIDEQGTSKLQHLGLVDITSLSPRSLFFSPTSWRVAGGIKRYDHDKLSHAMFTLEGGPGVSYPLANGLLYGLLEGEILVRDKLDKGFSLGGGVQAGYLLQRQSWQGQFSVRIIDFFEGETHRLEDVGATLSFNLDTNNQLRLSLSETRVDDQSENLTALEYHHYF